MILGIGMNVYPPREGFPEELARTAGTVFMEYFFPIRGWKTENDLWRHPRKYVVPAALLLAAGIVSEII